MNSLNKLSAFARRDFLKIGGLSGAALGATALSLPRISFGAGVANASTDTLVVVFLRGAMDGLSAVVPYTEPEYFLKRATTQIAAPDAATSPSIQLDNRFALHPSLAPFKPLYDAGELAIVHASGLAKESRSHFDAQDFMERAWMEKGQIYSGWLNRHLLASKRLQGAANPESTFRGVALGTSISKSLSGSSAVVGLSSIASFGLQSNSTRETNMADALEATFEGNSFVDSSALRAFAAAEELARINPSAQATENGALYPNVAFGTQMRDLAKLIKADVGVEVATLDLGGWDTHNNQNAQLPTRLDQLAKTLSAFRTDLGTRMQNVSVVVMTEFGRRFQENGNTGTDHGRASAMFLLGGGVRGKQVFTDWPGLAANQLQNGDLRVTTDYRAVLSELLLKRANSDALTDVFPGYLGGPTEGLFKQR